MKHISRGCLLEGNNEIKLSLSKVLVWHVGVMYDVGLNLLNNYENGIMDYLSSL
jgi:hypothetical protein